MRGEDIGRLDWRSGDLSWKEFGFDKYGRTLHMHGNAVHLRAGVISTTLVNNHKTRENKPYTNTSPSQNRYVL